MKNLNIKNLYICLIVIIILLISIIPYLIFKSNNNLYISVNGVDVTNQFITENDFSDNNDGNTKIITVKTEYGTNEIEISSHSARCIYSDCANQVCVNTGSIDKQFDNQMIICSPHRLVVGYK